VDPTLERLQHVEGLAAAATLIREGRIGEAVAEDDLAARERRRDDALHMVSSGREDEQRLGDAVHRLLQHQPAQMLGENGAAGLAGAEHGVPARPKRLRKRLDVGRLARPVDALEGDEAARHGGLILRW
jgi:hypothetical protein